MAFSYQMMRAGLQWRNVMVEELAEVVYGLLVRRQIFLMDNPIDLLTLLGWSKRYHIDKKPYETLSMSLALLVQKNLISECGVDCYVAKTAREIAQSRGRFDE